MEKLITVVVPVYNAERHLEKTITSILNQTYPHFELILVDDGSMDQSLQICQHYEKEDQRIRVMQQTNSGVSAARNSGIDASNGEFLVFVDSDDYIEENTIEVLIDYYRSPNELIIYGYYIHNLNKGNQVLLNSGNRETKKLTIAEFASDFWFYYERGITNSPCNKLYVSSIIKENKLYFPVGVRMGEDVAFNIKYFEKVSHIKVIDKYLYHYLLYPSQSTRQVNLTIREDMIFFLTRIESFIRDYSGSKTETANWRQHNQQLYKHLLTALRMVYQTNDITYHERLKYVKKTMDSFHHIFHNEMNFPKNKFDKVIVHYLINQNYKKVHQLLTLTETTKMKIKRVKNRVKK